jgi:transposase-like protein
MFTMPNAYPMEFRRDVVQVARNREPGVSLEKIAADFGIHPITLSNWLKRADVEDGFRPGLTSAQSAELREANKRIRLLEQEAEVLKRALAYVSQGSIPGKGITRS